MGIEMVMYAACDMFEEEMLGVTKTTQRVEKVLTKLINNERSWLSHD